MDSLYNRFKVLSMDSDNESIHSSHTPPFSPFAGRDPTPPPIIPPIIPAYRFTSIAKDMAPDALTNIFSSQHHARSTRTPIHTPKAQYRQRSENTFSKSSHNLHRIVINTNSNIEFPSLNTSTIMTAVSSNKSTETLNFAKRISDMAAREQIVAGETSLQHDNIDTLTTPIVSRFRRTLEDILADESGSTGYNSMNNSFSHDNYPLYDELPDMEEDTQ